MSSPLFTREEYMQLTLVSFNAIGTVTGLERLPLKRLIEKYLEHFVSDGTSTFRCKLGDFKELLLFLGNGDPESPTLESFTKRNVERFRDLRIDMGEAYATVNRRLATYKHFSRLLCERVPFFHDDIRHVGTFELPPPVSKALTEEERHQIRNLPRLGRTEYGDIRNRAIIELLMATGLRPEEMLSINIGHLDGRWIKQLKTKGRQIRNVYISTPMEGLLANYLCLRERELNRRCPGHLYLSAAEKRAFPLWLTFYRVNINNPETFRMSYETLRNVVYEIGAEAGIDGLHPHRFRHDMITGLRRDGHDLAVIQKAAGHKDIRTTMRYCAATDDELVAALEMRNAR